MTLGQNGVLRYGHFTDLLASKFIGSFGFKIGLYIKVTVNTRQNKFEVHI